MREHEKFELTGDILSEYLNGQLEVQNMVKGTVYRGQIKRIELRKGVLSVEFTWLAQAVADGVHDKWTVADDFTYQLVLSDKVRVQQLSVGRIMLSDSAIGDVTVLIHESLCRVTPEMIEGLETPKQVH